MQEEPFINENNDTQPALKNYLKWLRNISISPELHRVGPWQSNNDYYVEEDEEDYNEQSTHLLPTIDEIIAKKRTKPPPKINPSEICKGAVRQQSLDLRETHRSERKAMPMRQLLGLTLSPTNETSSKPKKKLYLERRESNTNISESYRLKTTDTRITSEFSNERTSNFKKLQEVVSDEGTLFTEGEKENSHCLDDHDKSLIMEEYMQTQSHRLHTLEQSFVSEEFQRKESLPTQENFDTEQDSEKLNKNIYFCEEEEGEEEEEEEEWFMEKNYSYKAKMIELGYSKENSFNLSVEQSNTKQQLQFETSTMREEVNTSSTATQDEYWIRKNSVLLNSPTLNIDKNDEFFKKESIVKSLEIKEEKSKILSRPHLRAHHYYQYQEEWREQKEQQEIEQKIKRENISHSREILDEELLQPEKIFPNALSNSKFIKECAEKQNKYSEEYKDVIKKICRLQRLAKVVNNEPHKKRADLAEELSQQQLGEKDYDDTISLDTLEEEGKGTVVHIENKIFNKCKQPNTETLLASINKKALTRFLPKIIEKMNEEYILKE